MTVKDHEKFLVFMTLTVILSAFGFMIYLRPLADSNTNSGVLQMLNMIIGALIGAFGAAVAQLLKASTDKVTVDNTTENPVNTTEQPAPTTPATGELPEAEKL